MIFGLSVLFKPIFAKVETSSLLGGDAAISLISEGIPIQNSDYFGMCDAVDNVIALCWEIYDDENTTDSRLVFSFGEDLKSVEDKLYTKDLILNYVQNLEYKTK